MQSLKEIRKKISSINNIWKLTSALETLSVVKMKRAQKYALLSKPFYQKIVYLLTLLKESVEKEESAFFKEKQGKILLAVLTSDRRFCGNFNQNIIRFTQNKISILKQEKKEFEIFPIGKVGYYFFKKRGYPIKRYFFGIGDFGELEEIKPISDFLIKSFLENNYQKIFLISTHFESIFSLKVKMVQVLPIKTTDLTELSKNEQENKIEFIIEPSKKYLLEEILPLLVEYIIYQLILESNASEHAARMLAMKQASENANEKFKELLLWYHKTRQNIITAEMSEIFSAKEVLEN